MRIGTEREVHIGRAYCVLIGLKLKGSVSYLEKKKKKLKNGLKNGD